MLTRRALETLCLAVTAVALSACGSARQAQAGTATCEGCHLYPPNVGAHVVHVDGNSQGLNRKFACLECHLNVQSVNEPGHITEPDGSPVPSPAQVRFDDSSALAGLTQPGATRLAPPSYDPTTGTCSNIYCHGAALKPAPAAAPYAWTSTTPIQCGTCHGLPPSDHPTGVQLTDCVLCHQPAVDATGTPNPSYHVNGTVDLVAQNQNQCSQCHGDKTVLAVSPGDPRSAPPVDLDGQSASDAVGAHQFHLQGQGGLVTCDECHVVPQTVLAQGHIDFSLPPAQREAAVVFGRIASLGPVSPTFNPANLTCSSTYCHGNFTGGNSTNTATWNQPSTGACGSCHGLPPAAPHPAIGASANCGDCHAGYNATAGGTTGTVNPATHCNGVVDLN
ncbi:MAG TPA: CxxxxCH/CxxCH domain-containing protein [Anaeromyxobacteraceae bacterium]|nr:CxxxxCH/CxxCH domain-containing protein [Anaeromyxobacteraceae bacterium]